MLLPTNQWGRKTQSHVFLKTHRKCNAYCVSRGTDTYPTCCVNATKNVAFLGAFGTSSIIMKYFHNLIGCKPPCFALTTKRGPAGEAATWGPYPSSHLLASCCSLVVREERDCLADLWNTTFRWDASPKSWHWQEKMRDHPCLQKRLFGVEREGTDNKYPLWK